jgi:hypothetical protein
MLLSSREERMVPKLLAVLLLALTAVTAGSAMALAKSPGSDTDPIVCESTGAPGQPSCDFPDYTPPE